jgi:glutamyl-tRNA synthetase
VPLVKERAQTLVQLAEAVQFALAKGPHELDEKTKGLLTDETRQRLLRFHDTVSGWSDWSLDATDAGLKIFVENEGIGFGKIGPALRGVLSPGMPAPDISKVLTSLGQAETLNRLNAALFI